MNDISIFTAGDRDYDLYILLANTRDLMVRARERELRKFNVSPGQSAIIYAIQAIGDKATPAKIARMVMRRPHSISVTLTRMEKAGLVEKRNDLDRKNLVRVSLTEKGRQAYHQTTQRNVIHNIMSAMAEPQRRELRSALQVVQQATQQEMVKLDYSGFPEIVTYTSP